MVVIKFGRFKKNCSKTCSLKLKNVCKFYLLISCTDFVMTPVVYLKEMSPVGYEILLKQIYALQCLIILHIGASSVLRPLALKTFWTHLYLLSQLPQRKERLKLVSKTEV